MAISIIQSPQTLSPASNSIITIATSPNQTGATHHFIFDIYSANTTNFLHRDRIPANTDGYAVYNAQRILKNYVSYDFNPLNTGITNATNSIYDYSIQVGEEYLYYFNSNSVSSYGGQIKLSSSTNTHYFVAGDSVLVTANAGGYGGVYTVVSSITSNSFVINATYSASYSATTASTVYSDSQRTIFSGLTALTSLSVCNAELSFIDFITYSASSYNISSGGSTKKLLTSHPDNYELLIDSRCWVNAYASNGTYNSQLSITTYDSGGNIEGSFTITGGTTAQTMKQLGVGPYNLNNTSTNKIIINSGSLPMIKSTTASYIYKCVDTGGNATSEYKRFKLYENCSRYTNIPIIFKDNSGSFITRNFEQINRTSTSIQKDKYNKIVCSGYNTYDRSTTVYNIEKKTKVIAKTGWMQEADANYLKQLFVSDEVYAIIDGNVIAIIILNSDYQLKTINNDNIIQYDVEFEYSFGG